jgi:hypothetical protein
LIDKVGGVVWDQEVNKSRTGALPSDLFGSAANVPECGIKQGEQEARHAFSQSLFRPHIQADDRSARNFGRFVLWLVRVGNGTGIHRPDQADAA